MTELLPSILSLSAIAGVALWLTISRGGITANSATIKPAVRGAVLATAAQAVHFAEEWATGFHERFPAAFGLPPMSLRLFVAFNLVWLGIWSLSAWGLTRHRRIALFPLWFLGAAGVANGFFHPLLALDSGSYFPGLVTSPLMGVVGVLLVVRLARATGSSS